MIKINGKLKVALSVVFAVLVILLVLTASIGLPIYMRHFYYLQIDPLGIPERTGFTYSEIRESFDQLMDYLTLPGREFSTGVFLYSEEGKSHFVDCKGLFDLNFFVLLISSLGVLGFYLARKLGGLQLCRPFGLPISAVSGGVTLIAFTVIGGLCAIDFDRAFVIFHKMFFPGKDNWLFNPHTDQIINALPETFFMRCGILIAASVIIFSVMLVVRGFVIRNRDRKLLALSVKSGTTDEKRSLARK